MDNMKVGVFAWLHRFDTRYSVASAAQDLLQLLCKQGLDPVFLTRQDFEDQNLLPPEVEVRRLPEYHGLLEDPITTQQWGFEHSRVYAELVKDLDVLCTQDVAFNKQFLAQYHLLREAQDLPSPGLLHWSHSLPAPHENKEPLQHSRYVALSYSGIPYIARYYSQPEGLIKVVHNCVDLQTVWGLGEEAWKLVSKVLDKEVLLLYPTRLCPGKRPQLALKFLRSLLDIGVSAGLVMALTYMRGEQKEAEYQQLLALIGELQVEDCVSLTSRTAEGHEGLGMDRDSVRGLYRACSCMLHTSTQESFGLTLLEAAAERCLLIINQDILAFREFLGPQESGHRYQRGTGLPWGSAERNVVYSPNEQEWLKDRAQEVVDQLRANPAHQAHWAVRKKYNSDWVWANQLLPALQETSQLRTRT